MSHHRRMLRKSEIKPLISEFEVFKREIDFDDRKTKMEIIETGDIPVFLFDGKPLLFKAESQLIPTLFFERYVSSAPRIVVDMGAIPHICNGADVMAPGVRAVEGAFSSGKIIVVVDETHKKPIAIGRALSDSVAIGKTTRGAVMKTLHYVGDAIYNASKSIQY